MDRQRTILCVDDEAPVLYVVSLKLSSAGYRVVTAVNGEEALATALANPPDLLITDYQMPLMDGLQLCQELRRRPETHGVPAVMLTARGFTLRPEDLAATNIVAVLSKPFSPRDILARAQSLLAGEAAAGAEVVPR